MRPLMPCGHTAKLLGHCVYVCSIDCDVKRLPKCSTCGSTSLVKHTFGNTPHERWHAEKWPNAVRCTACNNMMPYGGV